ncbi:MAG: hypothetical protein ABIC91_01710 [Nanoarchaeota archaeon]
MLSILCLWSLFQHINSNNLNNPSVNEVDWDLNFLNYGVARQTILKNKQMPIWNPYSCGGNILITNIQSNILYLTFPFIMFFGEVVGMKISIFFHLFIGMIGMFLLSKHYKMSPLAAYFPPIIFSLSGAVLLHLKYGMMVIAPYFLLPYIFLFFLKSIKEKKFLIFTATVLCLTFLGGGIYAFVYITMFLSGYAILNYLFNRNSSYIKNIFIVIIIMILIGAIKFLPAIDFYKGNPRIIKTTHYSSIPILISNLIQHNYKDQTQVKLLFKDNKQELFSETHKILPSYEYAMYIGILPLLILLFGLMTTFKEQKNIIILCIIFVFIYLGEFAPINLWNFMKQLPLFSSLQVPPRSKVMIIFLISIIIGNTVSKFEKKSFKNKMSFLEKKNKKKILISLLLIVISISLLVPYSQAFKNLFLQKTNINMLQSEFVQTTQEFPYQNSYQTFLSNSGSVNCYEPIPVAKKNTTKLYLNFGFATPISSKNYRGEVYLLKNTGTAKYIYWSPNKLIVEINTQQADTLIINQNYHEPWKSYSNKQKIPVKNTNDLISVEIKPENKKITLYYLPTSFIIGSIITITTITGIIIWTRKKKKFI